MGNKRGGAGLTAHARAWLLLSLRRVGFGGPEVKEYHGVCTNRTPGLPWLLWARGGQGLETGRSVSRLLQ